MIIKKTGDYRKFLFYLILILLLAIALLSMRSIWLLQHYNKIDGTVVALRGMPQDSDDRRLNRKVTVYPVVRYQTPDGQDHDYETYTSSSMTSYKIGQTVPLLLNPEDPTKVKLGDKMGLWDLQLGLLQFVGIIIVTIFGLSYAKDKGWINDDDVTLTIEINKTRTPDVAPEKTIDLASEQFWQNRLPPEKKELASVYARRSTKILQLIFILVSAAALIPMVLFVLFMVLLYIF